MSALHFVFDVILLCASSLFRVSITFCKGQSNPAAMSSPCLPSPAEKLSTSQRVKLSVKSYFQLLGYASSACRIFFFLLGHSSNNIDIDLTWHPLLAVNQSLTMVRKL